MLPCQPSAHKTPLSSQVRDLQQALGWLSPRGTTSPRWPSPGQPWGHTPPCSTMQLQCRRGSGSAINGRSTHWTPSQSSRHRQTRLCSLTHKRVFIPSSAASLSHRRPPLSFPSARAGEKTREQKPRTPEFQFNCWC